MHRPPIECSISRACVHWSPSLSDVRARLGGRPEDWQVREVGDGNLNLVFIVEGEHGSVCLKQALPYVRAAGPSWPMSPERAFFENAYYRAVAPHVAKRIPKIYHYDAELYCTLMERLSPHIILRHGLIAGRRYPNLARAHGRVRRPRLLLHVRLRLAVRTKNGSHGAVRRQQAAHPHHGRSDFYGSVSSQRAQPSHVPATRRHCRGGSSATARSRRPRRASARNFSTTRRRSCTGTCTPGR